MIGWLVSIDILLWGVVIYLVIAPPRYDPAIRLKYRITTGSWEWPK